MKNPPISPDGRSEGSLQSAAAGWLLLAMILLSITHGLNPEIPRLGAGFCAWGAGLLLFSRVRGVQRLQVLTLFGIGLAGILWAVYLGGPAKIEKALSTNQSLLAMLAAVSFLRLVTLPDTPAEESLPQGPKALWRTLFGVHFFGAVINLSAVTILGDRLSARHPLTPLQATVLSRGFAMAANWSPFFAAMGVALTNAPGAQLPLLSAIGLPLAMVALGLSGWQLGRREEARHYLGYPMHFGALWIPSLLALAVILAHHHWPGIPILSLISLLSLSITALLVLSRRQNEGIERLARHIRSGLPRMSGELLLFLAAGVLAAGIAGVVEALDLRLGIEQFGAREASLLLLCMVALSVVGVHPVISIATAGGFLNPLVTDPNLLAITFLMTWALGVSTSPFSGMHLAIQGRYGVSAYGFLRWNAHFALVMLGLDVLVLHFYMALAA